MTFPILANVLSTLHKRNALIDTQLGTDALLLIIYTLRFSLSHLLFPCRVLGFALILVYCRTGFLSLATFRDVSSATSVYLPRAV